MGVVGAHIARLTSGLTEKSQAGDDRGISPFKNTEGGHRGHPDENHFAMLRMGEMGG